MNDKLPWEVNPALMPERLSVIADIIVRVRREVAASMEPEEGDDFFGQWVPGTRVHSRLSHHITRAAESGQYPWLDVVNPGMQFTFVIEGIPIRIYRGEAEKPTRGARKVGLSEIEQQGELFDLGLITKPDMDWVWRMAVETEPDGTAFNITLCQVGPGDPFSVRNRYSIPLHESAVPLATVTPTFPEGFELQPAPVEELTHTSSEEGQENDEATAEGTGTGGASQIGKDPSSGDDNGD